MLESTPSCVPASPKFDTLPVEVLRQILFEVAFDDSNFPRLSTIDAMTVRFMKRGTSFWYRQYSKQFASLMFINKFFHELITSVLYESIVSTTSEYGYLGDTHEIGVQPFVYDPSYLEPNALETPKFFYSVDKLTDTHMLNVNTLWLSNKSYTSPLFDVKSFPDWTFFSAAQNLTHLIVNMNIYSFIYDEYSEGMSQSDLNDDDGNVVIKLIDLYEGNSPLYLTEHIKLANPKNKSELFTMRLQLLSNSIAKLIRNQKHKVKCTILSSCVSDLNEQSCAVDNYYHFILCSIIFAFKKEKISHTIEAMEITNSTNFLYDFLIEHLVSLPRLKELDYLTGEKNPLLESIDRMSSLEQLYLSVPALDTQFSFPSNLKTLAVLDQLFFKLDIGVNSPMFDNVVELFLVLHEELDDFSQRPEQYRGCTMKNLKTLVIQEEEYSNGIKSMIPFMRLNPTVTTFSVETLIQSRDDVYFVVIQLPNLESLTVHFRDPILRDDDDELLRYIPLEIIDHVPVLELLTLVIRSEFTVMSLEDLILTLITAYVYTSENLKKIVIYHYEIDEKRNANSPTFPVFIENDINRSTKRFPFFPRGVKFSQFVRLDDLTAGGTPRFNDSFSVKMEIDVTKVRKIFNRRYFR